MKTVKNKKISFVTQVADGGKLVDKINETDYFELIDICCNKPTDPQARFTYDDIKNIDKVKKALAEKKEEEVQFEDADFEFVKKQVANQHWNVADIQFVEFMDYIKSVA